MVIVIIIIIINITIIFHCHHHHHHHQHHHHHHHYCYYCERFEPRSHFKCRLSLIVGVNVVLNRTVVVDSD